MKVLLGMSGGVDSSAAAVMLLQQGHEVTGATMKLWGGAGDSGCCSLSDSQDARRVAAQLGIAHYVLNFSESFDKHVVEPYVQSHKDGLTPNPCIECNRHVKFEMFIERALQLGFDAVATGHYAQVKCENGIYYLERGVDNKKDQSYVLHMLNQHHLKHVLLPLGNLQKEEVRAIAKDAKLRTAQKPDSQDVCFIPDVGGREEFLGPRMELHEGELIDVATMQPCGKTNAIELITIGQRKGMGGGTEQRRYAVKVDVQNKKVFVGGAEDLMTTQVALASPTWSYKPPENGEVLLAQASAHGKPFPVTFEGDKAVFHEPQRRIAPGQSVVFYEGNRVVGGGTAC